MRSLFVSLVASCALFLAGCAMTPPDVAPVAVTAEHIAPIELSVTNIEFKNEFTPSMQPPYIEHEFRTPPYVAVENLLKKQLVPAAGGEARTLRAVIEEASVLREEIPVKKGFWEKFNRMPAERLKARVFIRFELVNDLAPDIVVGHAEVTAKRNKFLLEDTTLAERDAAYLSLTEDLMTDVNDGLNTVIRNSFGR